MRCSSRPGILLSQAAALSADYWPRFPLGAPGRKITDTDSFSIERDLGIRAAREFPHFVDIRHDAKLRRVEQTKLPKGCDFLSRSPGAFR